VISTATAATANLFALLNTAKTMTITAPIAYKTECGCSDLTQAFPLQALSVSLPSAGHIQIVRSMSMAKKMLVATLSITIMEHLLLATMHVPKQ
jgi:hypothetical protein